MKELLGLLKIKAACTDRFGALLIGQNMMSLYPCDNEVFDAYFTYLLALTAKTESLEEKQNILSASFQALDSFAANAKLDVAMMQISNASPRNTIWLVAR